MDKAGLAALIKSQRAEIEKPHSTELEVALGGELVTVEVMRLLPDDWQALVAAHPPRKGSKDVDVGHNRHTLAREYPVDRLRVGGLEVAREEWVEIYTVLDPENKDNVSAVMWGVNVYEAIQNLQALGKARAGLASKSPANRASRRVASKGGSPRKSRATTTQTEN